MSTRLVSIARALGLTRWRWLRLVMGAAYIDESGQPKGGVYLVLGALASRADEWQALEGDWVDAKKEYGFPLKEGKRDEYLPYHATDVLSPDSKFSREVWPVDLQTKMGLHHALVEAICTHVSTTAYTVVLHGPYKKVVRGDAKRRKMVYAMCGLGIASRLHRWAIREDEPLNYIFERAKGVNQGRAINAILELSEKSGDPLMIGSVTSECKGIPSLDAADIWCYELKNHIESLLLGNTEPNTSLQKLSSIHQQCGFLMGRSLEPFMTYLK